MSHKRRTAAAALLIFALALALRVAPVAGHRLAPERISTIDSGRYLGLAAALAAGEGLALPGAGPELFRTPGYPAVLALLSLLPGSRDVWILGLQMLLDAAAAVLCFVLISAWRSRRAGLVAGLLFAVDPGHVVYSNLLMADVLCAFAVVAGFVAIDRAARLGGPTALLGGPTALLAAAGACLGAATALRPIALLLFLPAALFLCQQRLAGRAIAAFAAAALLFPLLWTARNGRTADTWTLSTAFDVNLALVAAARVEARRHGLPRPVGEQRVMARVARLERRAGLPHHRACRSIATGTLKRAPGAAVAAAAASAAEMLLAGERRYLLQIMGLSAADAAPAALGPDLARLPAAERVLVVAQVVFMATVWILAAAGGVSLWRGGRRDLAILAALSLVLVLAPSLVVGTARLRIPVTFLIHGLAGIGVAAAARNFPAPARVVQDGRSR